MRLKRGTKLSRYLIIAQLGTGGMGEVYRAKDTELDREVALKVLPDHLASNADSMRRFQREAKSLAALSHPNILTIFDVGTDQGVSFVVTELLEGETLRDLIKHSDLKWEKKLEIAIQTAEGLTAAHSKGVIHRDLKPENIFQTKEGRTKILDFGLAQLKPHVSQEHEEALTESFQTESGIIMGSLPYMSPEQLRGDSVDSRTDIFFWMHLL